MSSSEVLKERYEGLLLKSSSLFAWINYFLKLWNCLKSQGRETDCERLHQRTLYLFETLKHLRYARCYRWPAIVGGEWIAVWYSKTVHTLGNPPFNHTYWAGETRPTLDHLHNHPRVSLTHLKPTLTFATKCPILPLHSQPIPLSHSNSDYFSHCWIPNFEFPPLFPVSTPKSDDTTLHP